MTPKEQTDTIDKFIAQQGNAVAAAATVGIHVSTLWRLQSGATPLKGPTLVAIRAVLSHPEEYAEFLKLVRPAHRPSGGS